MNAKHPFYDDPRLSAYALGEMTDEEKAAFEREIAGCPEALSDIEEIKACARELTDALLTEPLPAEAQSMTISGQENHSARPMTAYATPSETRRIVSKKAKIILSLVSVTAMLFVAFIFSSTAMKWNKIDIVGGNNLVYQRPEHRSMADYHDGVNGPLTSQPAEMALTPPADALVETYEDRRQAGSKHADKYDVSFTESESSRHTEFTLSQKPHSDAQSIESPTSSLPASGSTSQSVAGRGTLLSSLDRKLKMAAGNESNRQPVITEPARRDESERRRIVNDYLGRHGNAIPTGGVPPDKKPGVTLGVEPRIIISEDPEEAELGDITSPAEGLVKRGKPASTPAGIPRHQALAEDDRDHFRHSQVDLNERLRVSDQNVSGETYAPLIENEFLSPHKQPLSTFGLDVDTAAYANVRRFLRQNQLPPPDAVRIEELVNYFQYNDPQPTEHPLAVSVAHASCPWAPRHKLVRIGLKGKEIDKAERPISNLVFLIDVSGSMQDDNKLPLVRVALQMLAEELGEKDHISIVTYSNEARVLLPPTGGHQRSEILSAISGLHASGSTNGAAGIQLAYDTAKLNFLKEGSNRVILCTDGDFNVGITDDDQLVAYLKEQASTGIFLSVFGFGMGNLKDAKLEKIADRGNGHYGYIDSTHEARKVFVDELTSTLYTIAKDVKLQVEFNPARVGEYRLIGYENRLMPAQDFNDDSKDSGDLGAGHSVVALYEIVPTGVERQTPVVNDLKYQSVRQQAEPVTDAAPPNEFTNEWLTVKVRYQLPQTVEGLSQPSVKLEFPLTDKQSVDGLSDVERADFLWSSAVTMYGLLLRQSDYRGVSNYDAVLEMATAAKLDDPTGRKAEFLELVNRAKVLTRN